MLDLLKKIFICIKQVEYHLHETSGDYLKDIYFSNYISWVLTLIIKRQWNKTKGIKKHKNNILKVVTNEHITFVICSLSSSCFNIFLDMFLYNVILWKNNKTKIACQCFKAGQWWLHELEMFYLFAFCDYVIMIFLLMWS